MLCWVNCSCHDVKNQLLWEWRRINSEPKFALMKILLCQFRNIFIRPNCLDIPGSFVELISTESGGGYTEKLIEQTTKCNRSKNFLTRCHFICCKCPFQKLELDDNCSNLHWIDPQQESGELGARRLNRALIGLGRRSRSTTRSQHNPEEDK